MTLVCVLPKSNGPHIWFDEVRSFQKSLSHECIICTWSDHCVVILTPLRWLTVFPTQEKLLWRIQMNLGGVERAPEFFELTMSLSLKMVIVSLSSQTLTIGSSLALEGALSSLATNTSLGWSQSNFEATSSTWLQWKVDGAKPATLSGEHIYCY